MQLVSEIMSYNIAMVSSCNSVKQAIQRMTDWNISAVPVCDSEKIVGIVSRSDVEARVPPLRRPLDKIQVAEIMTEQVVYCFEDQPVDEVLQQMTDHRIKHLPVLNRDKELIGIVSLTDFANRVAGYSQDIVKRADDAFGEHALSSAPTRMHRPLSDSVDGGF